MGGRRKAPEESVWAPALLKAFGLDEDGGSLWLPMVRNDAMLKWAAGTGKFKPVLASTDGDVAIPGVRQASWDVLPDVPVDWIVFSPPNDLMAKAARMYLGKARRGVVILSAARRLLREEMLAKVFREHTLAAVAVGTRKAYFEGLKYDHPAAALLVPGEAEPGFLPAFIITEV